MAAVPTRLQIKQKWPTNYNTCLLVVRGLGIDGQTMNTGVLEDTGMLAVTVRFPRQERKALLR